MRIATLSWRGPDAARSDSGQADQQRVAKRGADAVARAEEARGHKAATLCEMSGDETPMNRADARHLRRDEDVRVLRLDERSATVANPVLPETHDGVVHARRCDPDVLRLHEHRGLDPLKRRLRNDRGQRRRSGEGTSARVRLFRDDADGRQLLPERVAEGAEQQERAEDHPGQPSATRARLHGISPEPVTRTRSKNMGAAWSVVAAAFFGARRSRTLKAP